MATSADRDEHDEKDEAAEDEESAEKKDEKAAAAPKPADEPEKEPEKEPTSEPPKAKTDEDEDDEDEPEEAKPAPKAAAKRPATRAKSRGPGALRAREAPAKPGGSLGKSVLLFFVIVIGLCAGFAILGREAPPGEVSKPKWTTGQTVDVEITVVKSDQKDLSCASAEEIGGKHCAFDAFDKPPAPPPPWTKSSVGDDKKLLKPYTTVDRIQFVAAGLWSDPALAADKIPATRFSVKCKFKVEGTLKDVGVRWDPAAQWYANKDWYAGAVSDCKIAQ